MLNKLYSLGNQETKENLVNALKEALKGQKDMGHMVDDKEDDFDLNVEI